MHPESCRAASITPDGSQLALCTQRCPTGPPRRVGQGELPSKGGVMGRGSVLSTAGDGHSTPAPASRPGGMLAGPCRHWPPFDGARLRVNVLVGSFSLG